MSAWKRRVWESQYCSAIPSSAKVEITPQIHSQVPAALWGSPSQPSQTHYSQDWRWYLVLRGISWDCVLSLGSKSRSYAVGLRAPFLMNLWHSLRTPFLFQSVLNGQLSSLVRRMVSLDFVIIQFTGSDESKNVSKSSILSKLILGATLEKYSYLVKSSFILPLGHAGTHFLYSFIKCGDFNDLKMFITLSHWPSLNEMVFLLWATGLKETVGELLLK